MRHEPVASTPASGSPGGISLPPDGLRLDDVEKQRDKLAEWIKEYSPISHVTKDDPPIGLFYGGVKGAKVGESHPDPTHSPVLGIKLA